MSLHNAVHELFNSKIKPNNPNVQLNNADVNRIVTNTVQSFSLAKDAESQLTDNINSYISKYKAPKRGGCNCGR